MGKIVKTLIAFIFAVSVFLIVSTIYLVKFSGTSFLGKIIKENVIRRPQLVRLFNLQKPGDGRYVYLDENFSTIDANIYYTKDYKPGDELSKWIDEMVVQTIGKKVNTSKILLDGEFVKDQYNDDDLRNIIHNLPRTSNSPALNIVYLSTYEQDVSHLGITINKDTIFIFMEGYESLGESSKVIKRLEQSTVMHEWGHLLGLAHVEGEDCIMSEMVHFHSDRELWTGEVPTQYCAETLYEIMRMRK